MAGIKRQDCCSLLGAMGKLLRQLLPIFLLVLYSFTGGILFYTIEHNGPCAYDFWASVWFANTMLTTVGYGRTHPCTSNGKIFACIFAVLGIPLAVFAFAAVGDLLVTPLHFVYLRLKRCRKCKKGTKAVAIDEEVVPVSIGLVLTFVWIGLTALYFYYMSQITDKKWTPTSDWYFLDSMYFVFISITTIGFGDFIPTNYQFEALHFTFIIIGLSLFSMCIALLQQTIRSFIGGIKMEIYRLYKQAIMSGVHMDNPDVKQLMKGMKGGRILSLFIGHDSMLRLQHELDLLAGRSSKLIQTEPLTNVKSSNSQTPKAIAKVTATNVVHMGCQTTKYFRVNADWHKEVEESDQPAS